MSKLTLKRKLQIAIALVISGYIYYIRGVVFLLVAVVTGTTLWMVTPVEVKNLIEDIVKYGWGCILYVLFPVYRKVFGYKYTYLNMTAKTSTKTRNLPPRPNYPHKRIVCISDTHTVHELLVIPDGDILVICGDLLLKNGGFFTIRKTDSFPVEFFRSFNEWLGKLPHPNKVIIGGNHDKYLQDIGPQKVSEILTNAVYLEFSAEKIDGIKFLGIPISPIGNSRNTAWQYTGEKLSETVNLLSRDLGNRDVDICLCHAPPYGPIANFLKETAPKVILCGHFHQRYGVEFGPKTITVNCASCTSAYWPIHPPVVFDFPLDSKSPDDTTINL